MGLRAWIGFIAATMFTPVFYVAILPGWTVIRDEMILSGVVDTSLIGILIRGLDWAPLMINLAALIHALFSPSVQQGSNTWRG